LRDSEEKFRAISESAGDATISIDTQGKMVFWNGVAETIFGYSANEMIGKPVTLIMPERFRENHQRNWVDGFHRRRLLSKRLSKWLD
jgi:PAS domain S-box-containing protein